MVQRKQLGEKRNLLQPRDPGQGLGNFERGHGTLGNIHDNCRNRDYHPPHIRKAGVQQVDEGAGDSSDALIAIRTAKRNDGIRHDDVRLLRHDV